MEPPDEPLDRERFPILRVLPEAVLRVLRRHYYAGVKEAETGFQFHVADEDAVTGALGERLIEPPTWITVDGQEYMWRTSYHKLRGRGANAPEKRLGADGIFQLEVLGLTGRFDVRKGLLFQSKIGWQGSDSQLLGQARTLLELSRSAIVIDYAPDGYKAVAATDVVAANGNSRRVRPRAARQLAEVLGDGLVSCTRRKWPLLGRGAGAACCRRRACLRARARKRHKHEN